MSNVFVLVGKFFNYFFVYNRNILQRLVAYLTGYAYLMIPVICLIIGFSVGLLKRIIHS